LTAAPTTIDAHVHIWDLERAEYPWLGPEIGPLYRSVGFDDIAPALRERGIGGAILVQASDEAADTAVMLDAAARHPEILGVVAWSPLDEPDRLGADLDRFAAEPAVVGIRNLVHERPREWLRTPAVERSLALLAEHGLPLDFPTTDHAGLEDVVWVGERAPGLTVVIDHLGKPPIGGTEAQYRRWRALIAECAGNPRVVAKVSGLYAATGPLDSWTVEGVRPFVEDALELFGPDRLLYGGDWPISELAGGYARTWDAITGILAPLSDDDRAAVLAGTARRIYLGG
jgi:L-fuconolactonase